MTVKKQFDKSSANQTLITGMRLIPAGEFLMGSPTGVGENDEYPQHKVYLDAYYIDKHAVTVAQYKKFIQATDGEMPEQPRWSTLNLPVVNVTWYDANAYCKWVGKRLPTEAEWEKAALGGAAMPWHFGEDEAKLNEYSWYSENSAEAAHPVGLKKPNQYELYDMHGNVWEWCTDRYGGCYYSQSPARNPLGPDTGGQRVLRGGSWLSFGEVTRASYRRRSSPDVDYPDCGFRCVAVLQ